MNADQIIRDKSLDRIGKSTLNDELTNEHSW